MDGILENFNDKSAESTFTSSDVESNKIIVAVCCIVSILFFLPLLMDKNSPYCKFYANQILTLFACELVLGIVCAIIRLIPVIGAIIGTVAGIAALAVAILMAIGAFKGKAIRLPFVGNLISIF